MQETYELCTRQESLSDGLRGQAQLVVSVGRGQRREARRLVQRVRMLGELPRPGRGHGMCVALILFGWFWVVEDRPWDLGFRVKQGLEFVKD